MEVVAQFIAAKADINSRDKVRTILHAKNGFCLMGDSWITGCFSGTASYCSTEIVPIMNPVQCWKFRTDFGPESSLRATCGEAPRFGSHDRIRHTCVSCDGASPIFLM